MFRLSVGDYWRYVKFTAYTDNPFLIEFLVDSKEEVGGKECYIVSWREVMYDQETKRVTSIAHGKYIVDLDTEKFVGAFRVTYDEEAKVGMFEHFSGKDVEFWGIKGLARLTKPLRIGEEWNIKKCDRTFKVKVAGLEEVKTYAGSFRCYLVETSEYVKERRVHWFKSWYSKELGIIVRSEVYDEEGDLVGLVELVEYRFKLR